MPTHENIQHDGNVFVSKSYEVSNQFFPFPHTHTHTNTDKTLKTKNFI